MNEVDGEVSEQTVRNVLNVMDDEGFLEHRWNESKWISVPDYR